MIDKIPVDIIIPTYRPDHKLIRCLELLGAQSYPIEHIFIINTEKTYFDRFMEGKTIPASVSARVKITHISAGEFDHGGTRRKAVSMSKTPFFVMMTQDAIPSDEKTVGELIEPMILNSDIAATYARQLPASGASETERYIRSFNYPPKARVKSSQDIPVLGIKTFFCSNVCAAYRRSAYDAVGGFINRTIFNEDMIIASALIKKGYSIYYAASSGVYHSHNYTAGQQFKRNFDLAVSQAEHPEVFKGISSESEGKKMVQGCIAHLKEKHRIYLIPAFIINCGARLIGYRLGKVYRFIPKPLRRVFSANPGYWRNK